MSFAIFLLPVVLSAAHYLVADVRKASPKPSFEAVCG
jgi:hypothetical protein